MLFPRVVLLVLTVSISLAAEAVDQPLAEAEAVIENQVASMVQLSRLEKTAALLPCPLPISDALAAFGGEEVLRWSGAMDRMAEGGRLSVSVYEIIAVPLKGSEYVIVLESSGSVGDATRLITKAAVAYRVPLGGLYYADPSEYRRSAGERGRRANQPPQRNAGSRPSSGDSSVSETPSSLGPRG